LNFAGIDYTKPEREVNDMFCNERKGIDDSLLFFFLLLVLLFCNPSMFGCGSDCEDICEPSCC